MRLFWYRDPDLGLIEITSRVRMLNEGAGELGTYAEEGSVWSGSMIIDDPDGDFEPNNHRILAVEETEAVDQYDRFIWVGYIQEVFLIRGPYRTGVSRQWRCNIADLNTVFSRRVLVGTDNDRPGESDNARIAWVEATSEGHLIDDTRYLTSSNPVAMDANDYTTQEVAQVYNDCAQQSGKNWYLTWFGDVGYWNDPWGFFSLWYDFANSAEYVSDGRLTNILADLDADLTWPADTEAELEIDGGRIYERIIVPYANTYVYATRTSTGDAYAKRDKTMPAENVKTKATAMARANRYVEDARTPEHRATITTWVPRRRVNLFRQGMMVPVKMSHWPEPYASEYTDMRILRRELEEVSVDGGTVIGYRIKFELSRSETAPSVANSGILGQSQGPELAEGGLVHWSWVGDNPRPGFPVQATSSLLEAITDGSPPNPDWPFSGWKVLGTGSVDVRLHLTTVGVLLSSQQWSITYAICKNGVVVASTVTTTPAGSSAFWLDEVTVDALAVAVVPDDVITATVVCDPPTMPFFRTPGGAGQSGERLEIIGGSLS